MVKQTHYPPIWKSKQFHCPHCGVYAKQFWADLLTNDYHGRFAPSFSEVLDQKWSISKCEHCEKKIIWFEGNIVYPKVMIVEAPNSDLSEDIKKDYFEAANIFTDSPRASAALLRLALQKLCIHLGEKGQNINDDIKNLVKKGLNPQIQKSLDILRITGNNAVHPGEINIEEKPDLALKLFELINFIAEKMITEPKELDGFYGQLPQGSLDQIAKRDNQA